MPKAKADTLCYHVARRQHDLIRHETYGYPLAGFNCFSFFTVRDFIDLSPEVSNAAGNGMTNTIAYQHSFYEF